MRILILFLIFFVAQSCFNNKKTGNENVFDSFENFHTSDKDTLNIKSIDTLKDSLSVSNNNNKNCISDFNDFFEKFSKDSAFQKKWVMYPLKSSYYIGDFYEDLQTEYIESSSYRFKDFSQDKYAMDSEYDKYTIHFDFKESEVRYQWRGYDNGIHMDYIF